MDIDIYDPHADIIEVEKEYGIKLCPSISEKKYDAIILAVSHEEFAILNYESLKYTPETVIFDTKAFLDRSIVDARL